MVCVVPTDSAERVEFLTVDRDSIIARTVVDASGRYQPYRRGTCQGLELGRWAPDGTSVLLQADYRCAGGAMLRSDAILDFTHRDAFSFVEGISGVKEQVRVVNFIVQLDTLAYPTAVRRRLPSYRPLSHDMSELDAPIAIADSTLVEASVTMPFFVVDAWVRNRGGSAVFALADRELQTAEVRRRQRIQRSLASPNFIIATTFQDNSVFNRLQEFDYLYGLIPSNVMITPAMVNFGRP
jgi:hypothetical protein